jgi:hypothetical protein
MSASDEELIAAAIEAVGPGETHVVVLARLIGAALRADGRLVDPKISTEGPGSTSPEPGPDVPTLTESEVIDWIADERRQWAAGHSTEDGAAP